VPLIRYFLLVGPALLGLLFLLGEPDAKPAASAKSASWTSADALRAMAHLGEPVRDRDRDVRFARTAIISSARASAAEPAAAAGPAPARASSAIMNAEARMDLPKSRRARTAKPRKAQIASRSPRLHTAVAENPQRMPADAFRAPSW
jgi:hypothetical protein